MFPVLDMKNLQAHLKEQANKVAEVTVNSQKISLAQLDIVFIADSFWSIMKAEAMNVHLRQEAYNVANMIAKE